MAHLDVRVDFTAAAAVRVFPAAVRVFPAAAAAVRISNELFLSVISLWYDFRMNHCRLCKPTYSYAR